MNTEPLTGEAPTVLGSYAHGWDILRGHIWRLVLLLFLFGVLQAPANVGNLHESADLLGTLYQVLVVGPLSFGLSWVFLIAVRGHKPEVSDLFAPFQRSYFPAVAASILLPIVVLIAALPMIGVFAIAVLGDEPSPVFLVGALALSGLPIFAAVRLSFVPYLLVDETLGPIEVLGESWEKTQPVQMQILGVELLSLPVLLLGLLLFLVGVFPAMILAGLALSTIYDDVCPEVTGEADENPAEPGPAVG